jgi:hypothetical protein
VALGKVSTYKTLLLVQARYLGDQKRNVTMHGRGEWISLFFERKLGDPLRDVRLNASKATAACLHNLMIHNLVKHNLLGGQSCDPLKASI